MNQLLAGVHIAAAAEARAFGVRAGADPRTLFEVISNMLPDEEATARGEPPHLAADNRIVVPVGEPLRIQVTGADVIHAFAVPSLWFKIDAVPGRLNERTLTVNEPGI